MQHKTDIRLRRLLQAAAALTIVGFATPAAAGASRPAPIISCRANPSLVPGSQSDAQHIRIQMRARRIDDYLPRCDLANLVAADANGRRRIVEKGVRWYVGAFACTYRYLPVAGRDEIDIRTRCIHHGRYASTVWFDAYG